MTVAFSSARRIVRAERLTADDFLSCTLFAFFHPLFVAFLSMSIFRIAGCGLAIDFYFSLASIDDR